MGDLKLFDLYTIGIGAVVGAGIVSYTGQAIALTGYSTWLAYICAIIFGAITVFPYFVIGATLRLGGGEYSTIGALMGEKYAGMFVVCKYLSPFFYATYGTSFGAYFVTLFPGTNSRIAGCILIAIFFFINYFGIRASSKVQNIMTILLFVGLGLFIGFGLTHLNNPVFQFSNNPEMFTGGAEGFWDAIIVLATISGGYFTVPQFGKNAANPKRDVPKAMLLCIPSLFLIYGGCGAVAAGVLPLSEVAGQPLTAVAKTIMPSPLFYVFIVGVVMAIVTSLNSCMVGMMNVYAQSVENGWLPKALGKKNKHGTPTLILAVMCLCAFLPVCFGINITTLTRFINLTNPVCLTIFTISIFALPKVYPEAWAKSTLHMPKGVLYTLLGLSIAARMLMFYNSLRKLSLAVIIPVLAALVALIIFAIFRSKNIKEIKVSVWE